MQDNNKYIEPESPHPGEFDDNGWVNLTCVENITSEFNRLTTPTGTKDLKVGGTFESKIKMLQLLSSPLRVECHSH